MIVLRAWDLWKCHRGEYIGSLSKSISIAVYGVSNRINWCPSITSRMLSNYGVLGQAHNYLLWIIQAQPWDQMFEGTWDILPWHKFLSCQLSWSKIFHPTKWSVWIRHLILVNLMLLQRWRMPRKSDLGDKYKSALNQLC